MRTVAEVRTVSSTGGEKGVKPQRHDLMPREALDAVAEVYAFGAEKYADHNWRKGYEWGKSYAALQRHMLAFWAGETYDEESGLPHLAHAAFHLNALLTWLIQDGEGGQFDDRYQPPGKIVEGAAVQKVEEEVLGSIPSREALRGWQDAGYMVLDETQRWPAAHFEIKDDGSVWTWTNDDDGPMTAKAIQDALTVRPHPGQPRR